MSCPLLLPVLLVLAVLLIARALYPSLPGKDITEPEAHTFYDAMREIERKEAA